MERYVLLFVAIVNVVVAGINLVTALMNYRNRKEPSSSAAKKGSSNLEE
ncbi:hypothetical protein J14TS2_35380 [Bacillus sp. J14TS2]|nr:MULTISPECIES: hypothetical protein [unclassified Bacillus (in: firmicutes)]MBO0992421.1 hypothetical protein [Bacillus sp. SD088]GIN73063.1 hypothetical protein J14TS2_35380 [Bacillus sp. J14TS2]